MHAGSPASAAEELAQEAMVSVWRKAATFDPERARLSTWIFTIARNLRIDRHRSDGQVVVEGDGRFSHNDDDGAEQRRAQELIPDPAASPDDQLGAGQRERGVRHALSQLTEEQALLLRLSFYDDHPHSRIARELCIPLGTVKSRIRLAVTRLRRLLDEFEP
jgi:RNA polymerase sigma-70 factor (ECF subfamily)